MTTINKNKYLVHLNIQKSFITKKILRLLVWFKLFVTKIHSKAAVFPRILL